MSSEVGLIALDGTSQENYLAVDLGRPRWYSEETARLVDREVKKIVDSCHEEALDLLRRERPRLDNLAEALLQRESLDEAEIRAVVGELQRQAA